ncbi:MAG: RNA methyltransferase [Methylobacteriaceae bacterium]|nr:RNA methyltransferase [Methylobacteriaceae bacterium]
MVCAVQQEPVVVLVEPQLGENIGMAARAMANFGLRELRLVAPRDGAPNDSARAAAAGAAHVLDEARFFDDAKGAVADLTYVFAASARERGQMKRVLAPADAMLRARELIDGGNRVGVLFGRERSGLSNDEVALADALITFPVDERFPSLNLAQAVLLTGYEWRRALGAPLPFSGVMHSPLASRATLESFLTFLEEELDRRGFYTPDRKPSLTRNMRDIFYRRELREQDVRTLRGIINALIREDK